MFVAALVTAPTLLILFFMMGFIHVGAEGSGASLQFPEMLRVNTPTAGDTGAHVLLPQIIEDMGLRLGWPLGWSNAWFAGFPVLYLYFPLPMLAIVLLLLGGMDRIRMPRLERYQHVLAGCVIMACGIGIRFLGL